MIGSSLVWLVGAAGAAETLPVDPALHELALPLPEALLADLGAGRWDEAYAGLRALPDEALKGDRKADWAFLVAYTATHGSRPEQALDVEPLLEGAHVVPDAGVALVRGELALARGEPALALERLAEVPRTSVLGARAAFDAHEALKALSREQDAWRELEALVARPDPVDGNEVALAALIRHHGATSEASRVYRERLVTWYPASEQAQPYGTTVLDWRARTIRAERFMAAGRYTEAIAATDGIADADARGTTIDACRWRYVRGRSQTKRNLWSEAAATLADAGTACVGVDGDYGARGAYLRGTALSRVKRYAEAADAYLQLAELYPTHSMADDGLTRAGIALREAGRPDEAREAWEKALERFPKGDTVPEALFRLAYGRYEAGDTKDAIAIADRLGSLPIDGDPLYVGAGRYWAARWRLYPSKSDPTRQSTEPGARDEAVRRWAAQCVELPQNFWTLQAYGRLAEVDPERAASVNVRPANHDDGASPVAWDVRVELLKNPHVRDAVGLFRVGLASEARREFEMADLGELTPDERGWWTELRIASGDWLFAHDELRGWIKQHPIGTLGPHEAHLQRVAYPDRYWTEVQAAVQPGWHYEPRLFHALVREESNFNRTIVSFAGARGLSQLMPATAKQTAGWLKLTITMADLDVAATNTKIGARYLEAMHTQLGQSPYLALAAYNAGAGNVSKWLAANGNVPTDEFVVQIPFDETRGYVSRVMGTWQVYRYRFDDVPPFPDLSAFNHHAKP